MRVRACVFCFFCFAPPIARLIHATARQADRTAKRVPRNMCPAPAYAAARPQMRMYLNIDMILLRKQHTLGQHKHTQNDLRKRHQFTNLMHKSSVCVCVFALCTQPDDDDGHVDDASRLFLADNVGVTRFPRFFGCVWVCGCVCFVLPTDPHLLAVRP